ncbi:wax ester/triacylglycerol synthase domain-containing protein [Dietzia sp. B44]|uniref:wax ester/triacylglycerol synthase domain-containing protein n=1 Tax=Dietzia sp. B44 TaxID=1630633 RepID=UPI001F5142F9|nr:wax ester/triacylglycerol synthase domain-containing protein [Dietzia sp. B44]
MTETRVRIPLRDQLWLMMDRPDNLMYINSVMWFAEVPDWDAVSEAIASRMVEPHPVFRRVPVRRGRRWYWQDDPDFDISRHLVRRRLPSPGGRAEAEAHVAEQMGLQLPDDRPIWRAEFIEGYHGHGGDREGALLLFRVQHGMVDGIRLTQLVLGLCDRDDDDPLPNVGRELSSSGGGVLGAVGQAGAGLAKDTLGIARGLAGATIRFPVTMARLTRAVVAPGRGVTRVPRASWNPWPTPSTPPTGRPTPTVRPSGCCSNPDRRSCRGVATPTPGRRSPGSPGWTSRRSRGWRRRTTPRSPP